MQLLHHPQSLEVLKAYLNGAFDTKDWFELKTEAERLSLFHGFDRLISLDTLSIQLYDHQCEAALRVLRQMRGRALLADEVGLGKTIEAGVVLKEYMLRGLARRILILVPASLVSQWRSEMFEKLNVEFSVGRTAQAFHCDRVVASIDTAKRHENAQVIHSLKWDMVVVDEAHRLKNNTTVNWKFVNTIEKKYLLLLTATPVQNDLRELYNLITLLKPGQLRTYSQFKREFMLDKHSPKNLAKLRELLSEVMVRRSRRETLIRFARREVRSLSVALHDAEKAFYGRMVSVLRRVYRSQPPDKRNLLPLLLLLRETCSHPAAARHTLQAMQQARLQRLLQPQDLRELIELSQIEHPAKLRFTMGFLMRLRDKAIVFTEFRATQAALMSACTQSGLNAVVYHGGLNATEKDKAIQTFRDSAQVLISTEAGGEGRNLQFCRNLINYDLPWNPMRVEQRIGRIHRLGQEHDVMVLNIVTEKTVESYVLYLLDRKIDMFDKVVGELDVILANLDTPFERTLGGIMLDSRDEAQFLERIEAFGRELEHACRTYENVRMLNSSLFANDPNDLELEA